MLDLLLEFLILFLFIVLIDTGGYKTSTTKKLFRKLGIDKPKIGSVSISGFGSKSPSDKEVEIAKLEFQAVQGELDSVIIETLGFDHLLGPLTPRNCQFSSNDWKILKELKIEDPPYGEFDGQIDLILGLNAFHEIWMYGFPKITLENGLVISQTIFGPVLSGIISPLYLELQWSFKSEEVLDPEIQSDPIAHFSVELKSWMEILDLRFLILLWNCLLINLWKKLLIFLIWD